MTVDIFVFLLIVALPVIVQPFTNDTITVRRYYTVTLECTAIGIPPPQIVWRKYYYNYGHPHAYVLVNSSSQTISSSIVNDSYVTDRGQSFYVSRYLVILSAHNTGTYICEASSITGIIRRNIQVMVQGILKNKVLIIIILLPLHIIVS